MMSYSDTLENGAIMPKTWYNVANKTNAPEPCLSAVRGIRQSEVNAMSSSDHITQLGLFDTIEIPLTHGYVTIIDAVDADLAELKWYTGYNRNKHPYAIRGDGGRRPRQRLHQIILMRIIGRPLVKGELCDHRDTNSLNNKRENLRVASNSQNTANSVRHSSTGFKGVVFNPEQRNWRAVVTVNYRHIHLGYFKTPEEAYAAYCKAAVEHFGEFARLK